MSKKKDLEKLKKSEAKAAFEQQQSAEVWALHREFAEHPARGITPQKLHAILTDAEQGNLMAQSYLFMDMEERDGHIYAEMFKRKRALLTLSWYVQAPPRATAAEKALAVEVQEWIENMEDFEDVMLDLLDGIGHGFSALEIEWALVGNLQLPCKFTHRPQSWFQTPHDDFNTLRLRDGSMDGAELWPLGWLLHTHKAKSGYVARSGLHRILAWPYLFKNYSVRDLAEFLEVYGLPMRLGKYPSGATNDEKATLLRAVTQIGHAAAGIIPQGMSIDFEEAAKGSHDPFAAMIDWCERTQSKAILGGAAPSQADGRTATHARVQSDLRYDLLEADARQLASTLTRGLVIPLLSINKPNFDPSRAPRFVFDTQQPEDISLFAEALPKLVDVGMKIPIEWAHDKLAIPMPEKADTPILQSTPSATAPSVALPPASLQSSPKALPNQAALSQTATAALSQIIAIQKPDLATQNASALYGLLDNISNDVLQSVVEPLLLPVIAAVKSAKSEHELLSILADTYPSMDDGELQEKLTNLMFVAEVWGRLAAQEELGQ